MKEIERESQTEALTVQLFKFLKSHYGSSWQQSFDQDLMADSLKTWANSMSGISPDQIDYAKQKITLGKYYIDFPPNPGQFRELCLSMPNKGKNMLVGIFLEKGRQEDRDRSRTIADKNLERIDSMIKDAMANWNRKILK